MSEDAASVSPPIVSLSWGRIEVEGFGTFKDAKLWPGGARAWDWNETGTRHSPGIQQADLAEILSAGVEVVVLTRGMSGMLGVPEEIVSWLGARGIEVVVERTEAAAQRYAAFRSDRRVGGLFHTTCWYALAAAC